MNHKRIECFALIILLLFVLTGCSVQRDEQAYEISLTKDQLAYQSEQSLPLVSEICFIEHLEKTFSEEQRSLFYTKVTPEEIEDYISKYNITASMVESKSPDVFLKYADFYSNLYGMNSNGSTAADALFWQYEPYLSNQLAFEKSTEEEFISYIKKYFEALGYPVVFSGFSSDGKTALYTVACGNGNSLLFCFMRSQDTEEADFDACNRNDINYYMHIVHTGEWITNEYFLYSANGKFILSVPYADSPAVFADGTFMELFRTLE